MKIIFIENMYRTYFWEAVAEHLTRLGHEIGWIVQNNVYKPKTNTNVTVIPYPKSNDKKKDNGVVKDFEYIRSTDRVINFFNSEDTHYPYYYTKFTEAIDRLNPDLVIGESTLFHEIMIIDICKNKKTPFLHPAATSYPSGRFSFYYHDTKEPFLGEELDKDLELYNRLIEDIGKRKVVPDYMKKPIVSERRIFPKHKSIQDKMMRLKAYIKGERYNTPSPFKKIKKDKELKILLDKWDALAGSLNTIDKNKKIILYPLQLQPEANLDVWGNTHRNQAELIQKLASVISEDWVVVVKTNPKSKYEMSEKLLLTIANNNKIIALDRAVPMTDIYNMSDIIVTVTGTIAIECVLGEKPLALLGTSIVDKSMGCVNINIPEEVNRLIDILEEEKFHSARQEDKQEVIHRMMTTSYPGLISDPVSNPNCLNEKNLEKVVNAFTDIIKRLDKYES